MSKPGPWLGAAAVGLSLTAASPLFFTGCSRGGGRRTVRAASAAAVVVETAEKREVPIIVELVARTEAAATVEIRANVEGRLTAMSFQEGRMVRKGQSLFRIDPRRYDAAVQSTKAAVEKAEADLEMAREQQHVVNAQSSAASGRGGSVESQPGRRTPETAGRAQGGAATGPGCGRGGAIVGRGGGRGRARHTENHRWSATAWVSSRRWQI